MGTAEFRKLQRTPRRHNFRKGTMAQAVGFNREKYIKMQSAHIKKRRADIAGEGGKLYLEMDDKLLDDTHAPCVLPGFIPDNKIAMLDCPKDDLEIMMCINAKDSERHKVRADLDITYEDDVLRLVDVFRERGFIVGSVVVAQLSDDNTLVKNFTERLQRLGLSVIRHRNIKGYPTNTEKIVSEAGFGLSEWVQTTRDLVIVTAPGPDSGELATCLPRIYYDHKHGIRSGYAKLETFPIWNLALEHPIDLAYEAITADLDDINLVDPFHLVTYDTKVTSYNRDVEVPPLLRTLLEKLTGESSYKSPTDMGVNIAGYCIDDDEVHREASNQKIVRRYYKALVDEHKNSADNEVSQRIVMVMSRANVSTAARRVVAPVLKVEKSTGAPGSVTELHDSTVITGKTSGLLGCSAAMLLNALKKLANIDPDLHLLSPTAIEPIQTLKTHRLGNRNPRLHTDEVLIALSVSAATSDDARAALAELKNLRNCDVRTTTILGSVDKTIFRNLGILVTSEFKYQKKALYQRH